MICLMYHNVFEEPHRYGRLSPSITSYFVSKNVFEAQIRLVGENGGCLSRAALDGFYRGCRATDQGDSHDGLPVLLTFDDGWRDSVEVAGPVLAKHQGKAMLFVTTDFIGRSHFLTRSELRALSTSLFAIGSHARTHRMLSQLSELEIVAELDYSKRFLEDALGRPIDALSIPNGAVDQRVRRIASEVGYRFVFTSDVYVNTAAIGPLHIGRVAIKQGTSMRAFQGYLRGHLAWERLRRCFLTVPKGMLGVAHYAALRRRLLGEAAGQQVMQEI
jgi:peptidoglycan/xylan/chitin deacetylase (PgdA/CDA1 family)